MSGGEEGASEIFGAGSPYVVDGGDCDGGDEAEGDDLFAGGGGYTGGGYGRSGCDWCALALAIVVAAIVVVVVVIARRAANGECAFGSEPHHKKIAAEAAGASAFAPSYY